MKNVFIVTILLFALFSCHEIKRVELTEEVKEELSLTKPMNITDAEISAVANEIGDELIETIDLSTDTTFTIEEHRVSVLGAKNKALMGPILKSKFEAYQYSFENGQKDLPALVKFKSRGELARYEKFMNVSDSTFKMVLIDVSVREVTKRIAKERKKKK